MRPGDEVAITGNPSIRGTPHLVVVKIVMRADGNVVVDRTAAEARGRGP